MPSKTQHGGDLLTDVRNLAIPFSLLIAQKGLEYVMNKDDKPAAMPAKAKSARKTQKGGAHDGCALCAASAQAGGANNRVSHARVAEEFRKLSQDLQELLTSYKEHVTLHSQ